MRVIAFAGPSLDAAARAALPQIAWHPPAEAGDLLRLAVDPPDAICLIDGYFDQRPAVRHKEILLLLSRGARIYGASSIGALRAAEMDIYGMVGVGAIYAAYRDGRIEGDDEVALLHAPAALDWRPLSLPLVDVRATLDTAHASGIIAHAERHRLLAAAAAIFYQDRDWAAILAAAGRPSATALQCWLEQNAVPQKAIDARACITAALNQDGEPGPRPEAVMPGFVAALARECGLAETPQMQAPHGTASISPRAPRDPGTDAET